MELLAYGEDALTLWALKDKLSEVLAQLGDSTAPADCQCFFRPSFGRSGGAGSSQFGEFDFLILADEHIYLGESKWNKSSGTVRNGVLTLEAAQLLRHQMLRFYIRAWMPGSYATWAAFESATQSRMLAQFGKPVAPAGSLLATNLHCFLSLVEQKYATSPQVTPQVQDVLLYPHAGVSVASLPAAVQGFSIVHLDYSAGLRNAFLVLNF